jgi:phosphotriesterase-related protein
MIRTVLGDIEPADLGVCYAHEHIIIDPSVATLKHPHIHLPSVENGIEELQRFHAAGGRAMVDSMPCDAGRNVGKLALVSQRSGVHILCPTGLHLAQYYDPGHWSHHYDVDRLTDLFIADIGQGIDRFDYSGPTVERTSHKAGLIKVATEGPKLRPRCERIFEAAARAQVATGVAILTHTEQGNGALEQVQCLTRHGVDAGRIVLSHTDRRPDLGYHREILSTGVRVEYDSGFRWKGDDNPTLDLLEALLGDFPDQIMLGMDAARPAYWVSYGGSPGLDYLLTTFTAMMRERGLGDDAWHRMFLSTPAVAYDRKPTTS